MRADYPPLIIALPKRDRPPPVSPPEGQLPLYLPQDPVPAEPGPMKKKEPKPRRCHAGFA